MDAVIRIIAEEFDENLIQRLKQLVENKPKAEITISISDVGYKDRLTTAIENVESKRNITTFTIDEFEEFKKQLLNEP